jgi:BirA family transcriptional regulator, biotin operon repressor / biotin---[acetyl-CoA-carboxylase] ligase
MELLSHQRILQAMSFESRALLQELQVLDHIDSTNTFARQRVEQGMGRGYVCMAERQSQGRGRLGRQWVSPFGRNMYLSAIWEFHGGVAELEGLSLAVGVAVCRAIQSLQVEDVSLKWPNDILLGGRKVGGILLEMLGDPVGLCQVVVGIGINFAMPKGTVIDQPWADLGEYDSVTRNGLASEVLSGLLPLLSTFSDLRFPHYRRAWEAYDAHRGVKIQLTRPGKTVVGVAQGVSDSGAICLEIDGEQNFFSGGEISLRRLG